MSPERLPCPAVLVPRSEYPLHALHQGAPVQSAFSLLHGPVLLDTVRG